MAASLMEIDAAHKSGSWDGAKKVIEKAGQRYAQTVLPGIELPPFLAYLKEQANEGKARFERETVKAAEALYQHKAYAQLYALLWQEKKFRQRLLDGQVITASHPRHAQWQAARAAFAPHEPRGSFTERWSMSYENGAGWQPLQAFTSIFLHGSTSHLLGNMVFLFLFGFTLELALGSFTYLAFYVVGGIGASRRKNMSFGIDVVPAYVHLNTTF